MTTESASAPTNHREDAGDRKGKASLFCRACGHAAPVDEWDVSTRQEVDGRHTDVACPNCGTVAVSQPEFRALA